MTNCQKDPACAILLKIGLFKDLKNDIPVCQTHKYKNTNTKNTNTKNTNTKNTNTKYTNTAHDEVPERPSMWYIFEKMIVQRYQKLYSHVSNQQIQNTNTQMRKYTNT